MMATTHVFAGVSLAVAVAAVAPEFAPVAVAAAMCGGLFPDLDLYAGHRRTLHFPVYYSVCAAAAGALAIGFPTTATVGVATFLLAAAIHSAGDALGGGLEPRPWEATSERAVYDHFRGRWIRPRRWVRYDGAPEDLALASVLAAPGLLVFDGVVRRLLLALLAISVGYAAVRKPLVFLAERVVTRLPARIRARLPARMLPATDDAIERGTT